MAGTTSLIISNILSSLERLSQFMPTFSSLAASSSSSIAQEDVTAGEVNSIPKRLMEDLSRLSRMLRRIQAVLHDAEEREINEKAIQLWLNELREVAYDAEDVLDQYDYQVIKIQFEGMTATTEVKPSLKRKQVDDDDVYGYQAHVGFHSYGYLTNKCLLEWKERPMVKNGDFSSLKCLHIFDCENLQQISTFPLSLEIIYVKSCKSLEYIVLPYSSGQLPRLQKVKIFCCDNLKSVINMNNLLGTLKVLKLVKCSRLEPDSEEEFDHSFGRVSFEEGFALVHECPRMRKWSQWHGFTCDEDWTAHMAMLEEWVCDYNFFVGESDDSSSDELSMESNNRWTVLSSDWRSQLQPIARQRIVNKIMDTLNRHFPVVDPEGMTDQFKKIAVPFEEKIYAAAANQSDYIRKISLKMRSMELTKILQ